MHVVVVRGFPVALAVAIAELEADFVGNAVLGFALPYAGRGEAHASTWYGSRPETVDPKRLLSRSSKYPVPLGRNVNNKTTTGVLARIGDPCPLAAFPRYEHSLNGVNETGECAAQRVDVMGRRNATVVPFPNSLSTFIDP